MYKTPQTFPASFFNCNGTKVLDHVEQKIKYKSDPHVVNSILIADTREGLKIELITYGIKGSKRMRHSFERVCNAFSLGKHPAKFF